MPGALRALRATALLATALLAAGQAPAAPGDGLPCDVSACRCGGEDLSSFRGKVYDTPVDADGNIFRFKMCEPLTTAELPKGCRDGGEPGQFEHAAVTKFSATSEGPEMECEEVGSFGPCPGDSPGDPPLRCGMTYNDARTDGGTLLVMWDYTFAITNSFRLALTAGTDKQPTEAPTKPDSADIFCDPGPQPRSSPPPLFLPLLLPRASLAAWSADAVLMLRALADYRSHWASIGAYPTPAPAAPAAAPAGDKPGGSGDTAVLVVVGLACVVVAGAGGAFWMRKRRHNAAAEKLLPEYSDVGGAE